MGALMKHFKIINSIALALLLISPVMLEAAEEKPVNDKGVFTLQAGSGLGINTLAWRTYLSLFDSSQHFYIIPPITLSGNFGIIDLVSAGFVVGYEGCGVTDDYIYNIMIGARSDFHFNRWIKVSRLDVYAGVVLGVNITSYTHVLPVEGYFATLSATKPSFLWNVQAGVRYYFNEVIGVWVEAGYGYSIVSGGLIFKF